MNTMFDLKNLPFPHPKQLPSRDDIRQAKTMIHQLDQDIQVLNQELSQLQRRLRGLEQKRTNYASYISPLRRLPTEILSEIISLCIQEGVDITVMAGICTRLREVALGMSGLWSTIQLRAPRKGQFMKSRLYHQYGSSIHVSY
jgi:hypothetical protein